MCDDLCGAIRLATPTIAGAGVSVQHGRLLAAAHMQRGLLIFGVVRRTGEGLRNEPGCEDLKGQLPKQCLGLDSTVLETMASRDFESAGRYGDKAAWEMSAATTHTQDCVGKSSGKLFERTLREQYSKIPRLSSTLTIE